MSSPHRTDEDLRELFAARADTAEDGGRLQAWLDEHAAGPLPVRSAQWRGGPARRRVLVPLAVAATVTAGAGGAWAVHRATRPADSPGHSVSSASTPPAPSSAGARSAPAPSRSAGSSATTVPFLGPPDGPVPAGFVPYSATFVSTRVGWQLGTAPCPTATCASLLRTRDGGRTWHGIPAPKSTAADPSGTGRTVATLRFADQLNGWAAGGQLFATHDGGATWRPQRVGAGYTLGLEAAAGYVYLLRAQLGTAAPVLSVSQVGSDDWTTLGALPGATQLVVHGADWFVATTHGVEHGSGTARPTRLPDPCPLDAGVPRSPVLAAADATHLDALCSKVGGTFDATYQLYGTVDGARHWSKSGPERTLSPLLTGLADNGANVLLVAQTAFDAPNSRYVPQLLRSTDDGRSLRPVYSQPAKARLEWRDLGFTDTAQGFAVLAGPSGRGFYMTRDAGLTWQRVSD